MFSGHIASFKIGVLKVQDFGNFELSPMLLEYIKSCINQYLKSSASYTKLAITVFKIFIWEAGFAQA